MRISLLCLALAASGCATTYKGPSFQQIANICVAEGHSMRTIPDCQQNRFEKYAPDWRSDRDGQKIASIFEYGRLLGKRVNDGSLSNDEAFRMYMDNARGEASASRERERIESAERAQRSAAALTGAAIIMGSPSVQPVYAPPVYIPPYPSDTTIVAPQSPGYRFYDSRPYK